MNNLHRLLILPACLFFVCSSVHAQNDDKEVSLGEVVVKASRVVNKNDGFVLYITDEQRRTSNNGYSVLKKLALPNIRVSENNVSALDNRGCVQLRINGIIADDADMKSVDPKLITRISYIDNPGVRFGEDVDYVIDIQTRRENSGYAAGIDFTQSLNKKQGSYMGFGKWNRGRGEFSLSYDFSYYDADGGHEYETADYHLSDGTIHSITRDADEMRRRVFDNNVKLKYNYADSSRYVFQVSLASAFSNTPGDYSKINVTDGNKYYPASTFSKDNSQSPVLDIYYSYNLTPRQSITMNAVGTYIFTDAYNSNNEGSLYQYDTDGRTASLLSEVIYENRLKPFTFSMGFNYKQKYTCNRYIGNLNTVNNIHNNRLHLFSNILGNIGRLKYSVGLRATYMDNRQHDEKFNRWFFCPKTSLTYSFSKNLSLTYNFDMYDRTSRIAMTGDAAIRQNSMEWKVGAPKLKANRDIENIIRVSYNKDRLQTFAELYYRRCQHPNMALYERTEDDKFITTQRNQKRIEVINAMAYVNYWLIPSKLNAMMYGGLFRCFNFGDYYTHCRTYYFMAGSVSAYIGNLMISASADNGYRFLEGETKGYNASSMNIETSYTHKNWYFSLIWHQPFCTDQKMFQSENLNRNMQKYYTLYSDQNANRVSFKVSYRFGSGRRYKAHEKKINLKDTDTGIIG